MASPGENASMSSTTALETPPTPTESTPVPSDISEAVKVYKEVQCLPEQYFNCSLFKDDNTGTDKLKGLLTGIKKTIHDTYSDTDCQDLMPDELARFYHDVDGDGDQLFAQSPSPSIAFIYKSLACPYSLQPQPHTSKFVEPTIPALKSEGWLMWTTIQLLLGPEEHSGFLMRAVEKWDIVDPMTGLTFPKTLPRECFPAHPDKSMVAWYEGVSERLRKEAEEEAKEHGRQSMRAEQRRLAARRDAGEASIDSRGPALAYFRNPLYRHVDGRPSIVQPPRRPPVSPGQSLMDRARNGALAVGNVVRNVANPRSMDGQGSPGISGEQRDRRRRSVSDNRHHHPSEPTPEGVPYDDGRSLPDPHEQRQRATMSSSSKHGSRSSEERSPRYENASKSSRSPSQRSPSLRHSRSHDPTPTQREHGDYFGTDMPRYHRRGSAYEGQAGLRPPAIGPSFEPSDAPPFAAQVADYPSIERPRDDRPPSRRRDPPRPYPPSEPRRHDRREDAREDTRDGRRGDRREDRRDDRRGPPRERSRPSYKERPPHDEDEGGYGRRRSSDQRDRSRPGSHRRRSPYDDDRRRGYDSPGRRASSRSDRPRRSIGSDPDSGYSGPEEGRRSGKPKQTRFAQQPIQGVDGRRYVDEAPWK